MTTTFEKPSKPIPALGGAMGRSYLACLRFEAKPLPDDILRLCLKSAVRVELLGPGVILLDLGVCREDEAQALIQGLLPYLGKDEVAAGIGPTGILAQLALLVHFATGRTALPVPLITPEARPAFLGGVPVRLLPQLYPGGIIRPDHVENLDQYGLHTLGQVALLGESTLRRQFGVIAGAFLAAVAAGRDPRPFCPALPPRRQGLRLRFAAPASSERLLSALPYLSRSATNLLQKRQLQTGRLRIRLQWVEGGTRQASKTLRQPINDKRLLAQALHWMALPLLSNHSAHRPNAGDEMDTASQEEERIAELQLFLEDEIAAGSEQQVLWSNQPQPAELERRERKLAALQALSQTLARRHSSVRRQPLLFRPCLRYPDAIFPEERYSQEDFAS